MLNVIPRQEEVPASPRDSSFWTEPSSSFMRPTTRNRMSFLSRFASSLFRYSFRSVISVTISKRPRFEIVTLMSLLKEYLNKELANLLKNDIRFRVVGRMNELDGSVQKELSRGLAGTSSCRGMTFNIALNYGGRTDIVD